MVVNSPLFVIWTVIFLLCFYSIFSQPFSGVGLPKFTSPPPYVKNDSIVDDNSRRKLSVNLVAGFPTYKGFTVTSSQTAGLGYWVAAGGDINGDGFQDLLAGAPSYNAGDGLVAVIYGSAFPTSLTLQSLSSSGAIYYGSGGSTENAGISTAAAGDINKDGYGDFLIGSYNYNGGAGRVHLVYGGPNLAQGNLLPPANTNGIVTYTELAALSYCGYPVGGGGDINGDSFVDIVIGCPWFNSHVGKAYVVFGKATMTSLNLNSILSTQGFVIYGIGGVEGYFSYSISIVGDLNHDGIDDLMAGNYCFFIIIFYFHSTF
jgi:hypothetical protein